MELSLGPTWQGWRADTAVTFALESAFCEAPAGEVVQLVKRIPVRPGEVIVFEVLARRTTEVVEGTEAQWQGLQINYYPFEGSQPGGPAQPNIGAGRSRANEIVLRPELQEYQLALAVPATADGSAFVEICCGSFGGSAAGLEFLRPRVRIEHPAYGSARQIAACRLIWNASTAEFEMDADSPNSGIALQSYSGGIVQLLAPTLSCPPHLFVQAEASASTRSVLAKAGRYDKTTGAIEIELIDMVTGALLPIESIASAELALNLTIEV